MSECYRDFFIYNFNVLKNEQFEDSMVSKGTSLYEVIRIIDQVPIFLENHLQRLQNSAGIADIKLWMDKDEIKENIIKLIKVNKVKEGNIKIVFNYEGKEENPKNTFLAYFIRHHYPSKKQYENGVPTVLCFMERSNPNAKIINTDLRKAADEKLKESSAYEAILVDRNGNITEGSRSNVFMVKEDAVLTAPLEDVLPGITRQMIIKICNDENIKLKEDKINYNGLNELDALFITGTSPKVLPINKVENIIFNSPNNSIVQKIAAVYNNIIEKYKLTNKVL